jgi:DNA-binding response OmpR family regulator
MPTILVVEDEPAILELLKVNLVDAGYDVRTAPDAETAQTLLRESLPDLLLLDWMLPGQSGLAFARQLRADARTKELPVIMVTARTDEADRVAGLEAWVDDYVTKPFSPRELKARIAFRWTGDPCRSGLRSSGFCGSSWRGPNACTRARSSWTRSGAITSTSRSGRSTCTSAGCASHSSLSGRTG